jgi:hypothetical protein
MFKLVGFGFISLVVACSGTASNVQVTQVNAASAEKGTADKVKGYAQPTPPSNAMSMGMQSSPQAGGLTIPITNVEVFEFQANVDADSSEETLYWAEDGEEVYVWGQIDLDCVDDTGASTGETGVADFVYASDSSGWGWMTSTDACGYSTDFGCSDDGGGEVCGGCDWNDAFIACAAAS